MVVRLLVLAVVVAVGISLSTGGVLGQSGESSKEPAFGGGKLLNEETNAEKNSLNGGNGPPPPGTENNKEYTESWGELNEIGNERIEAASGNESKGPGELTGTNGELQELDKEAAKIITESNRELATVH